MKSIEDIDFGFYTLTDELQPIKATYREYFDWKNRQPNQTGFGVRVAKTEVGDVVVSTVFLGTDHAIHEAAPVLWETMVFGGECDQEQARYTSYKDAIAGHEAMCKKVFG